ncbi:histidine phosphotransferase family protein [Pelagovum pacificum]|uniref:Histidine phosphotransferase n=1 Tax=Pelagovum pacificum TaxID=2588711 RepID=A0A5C5GBR6_9RHOB|nr:histidine phosphotransferase family protein [Pelagovum pacificum]QQA44658.1 histidine phosphotransferase [Pelagovum pacificum]TNY32232.1 histidine phosphotransferase [Pelagovum pacificum]
MITSNPAELIASRICHDVINPMSAISNGLELLSMMHDNSPELDLVSESALAATARLRFLRLAFGAASPAPVPNREVTDILSGMARTGFVKVDWAAPEGASRDLVACAFLGLLCIETVLGKSGRVTVSEWQGRWTLAGAGAPTRVDPSLWSLLDGTPATCGLKPAEIQFLVLPRALSALGRTPTVDWTDGAPTISF